jgi:aminopeptidase N
MTQILARASETVGTGNPPNPRPTLTAEPPTACQTLKVTVNNLTRLEAQERARLLRVDRYDVHLDVSEPESGVFVSTSTVRFHCARPGASTFLEISAPFLSSVEHNGRVLDPDFDGHRLRLHDLAEDNVLTVVADAAYSRTGEGLHRFVDPVDGLVYLYSQFEAYDAHRMYACFDQPDLKAQFRLQVSAPATWTCVSNSAVETREEREDGTHLWSFAATPRLSTYITAVVAGPYHEVHSEHDGIELGLFCRASLAGDMDAEELFEVTGQGFDFYHQVFDYRYPFGKYDQLFVPEFNAGAMENAGCVTFLEDYLFRSKVTDSRYERRAETLLHEMAHMWFGDLVTMSWWDDLWLNESFASYMAVLSQVTSTRWSDAWTTFCNTEKTWAYRQDQLPSTHPIAADATDIDTVRTNFDGITYAKGAAVLKQLVSWVGQEEFLAGLRTYFRRHQFSNTSLADLLAVLEEASGRDLSSWSAEWLQTTGVNTLRAEFHLDGSGTFTRFEVLQEAQPGHPTLRSHRIAIGLYDLTDDILVRRERVELDVTGPRTDVPKLVGLSQPDLVLLNDDDLTYAKIRLDPRSETTLVRHIGDFSQSLPRALCWNAAWDMTRDAQMPATDWVSLVLSGLHAETDIGVVHSLLAKTDAAVTAYADPSHVPALEAALAEELEAWLYGAEPGSDFQLTFVTAYARSANTPEHQALVRGLLDGTTVLPGLRVDTDLRWTLLTELVSRGAAGDEEIEAELARDRTAAGEKRAASARTSRPTPAAKAAAWQAVMESDALSNHLQAATMNGFWIPEQIELSRPYVERYFERIEAIWETRSQEIAHTITAMLYPSVVIEQGLVERTREFVSRDSLPTGLARMLSEGCDGVERALRARARDRAGTATHS